MEKNAPKYDCTKNNHLDSTTVNLKNRTEVKSCKQKLIQNLLLEVKRTTALIEQYNKVFFLEGKDQEVHVS